jgi:hypothetical protein
VGYGNRFMPAQPPGVSWNEEAIIGTSAYLNAVPASRSKTGRINVFIDYGTNDRLICWDTNFQNEKSGSDCTGRVR